MSKPRIKAADIRAVAEPGMILVKPSKDKQELILHVGSMTAFLSMKETWQLIDTLYEYGMHTWEDFDVRAQASRKAIRPS